MACFLVPMGAAVVVTAARKKFSEKFRVGWLLSMLWGGVVMLATEHIINGEVVAYPPFLTASSAEITVDLIKIGVPMLVAVVAVWAAMVSVSNAVSARKAGIAKAG